MASEEGKYAGEATFNGKVIARTTRGHRVEGNIYFPKEDIEKEYFTDSSLHTTCGWKGVANYYNVEVDGKSARDAAWYYPDAKSGAKAIEGYVAFYGSKVTVRER